MAHVKNSQFYAIFFYLSIGNAVLVIVLNSARLKYKRCRLSMHSSQLQQEADESHISQGRQSGVEQFHATSLIIPSHHHHLFHYYYRHSHPYYHCHT